MTSRTLRRAVFALALTTTLSMVSAGTAAAGPVRWRNATPTETRVLEGRTILFELWSRLVGILGAAKGDAGVIIDGNG